MGFYDDLNNDIYYIVEVEVETEKLYMFTKRVALHFPVWVKSFYISVLHSGISKIQFLMK